MKPHPLHYHNQASSCFFLWWVFRVFFSNGVVPSTLFNRAAVRGEGTDRNRERMEKLVQRCILGCPLEYVTLVGEKRMLGELESIVDHPLHHHPLHDTVSALRSSFSQTLTARCRKERLHTAFFLSAIRLFNSSLDNNYRDTFFKCILSVIYFLL